MARCPRCQEVRQPTHVWLWSTWVCPGCNALLKRVAAAQYLGIALTCAGLATLLFSTGLGRSAAATGELMAFAGVLCMLALDRAKVVAEGPFCAACGYDLSGGDEVRRCPECGVPR
jgi:hypothetical protein